MKFLVCLFSLASAKTFMDGFGKPAGDKKPHCDYTYVEQANGYLKYHEIPLNWNEARLKCDFEGAVLASPLTPMLQLALVSVANLSILLYGVWTGIHAKFAQGDFFSMEGTPLSLIPHSWANGEPSHNLATEKCIAIHNDGLISTFPCEMSKPYLCYKNVTREVVLNECGTSDNEYKLDKRTGSCYKFHDYPRTWSRAYETCVAEGGYLAIINSDDEAKVIKEIYVKGPLRPVTGIGDYYSLTAYIGFHDWGEHGEWRTIHGQTLKEAGYNHWSPGEPNNLSAQFCGGVYRTGLLDDVWCQKRGQFICEKDPKYLVCR